MLNDLAAHDFPPHRFRYDFLLVLGSFAILGYLAIVVARQPGSIATIWLANGTATALIVSAPGPRRWHLLAAVALGNLLANLAYGDPLSLALAFVPPNLIEVAFGVLLVLRCGAAERFANEHASFLRVLAAGAFVPPLLGATLGAATLEALGFANVTRVWADWYIGAALGSVATLPLVLALRGAGVEASLRRIVSRVNLVAAAVIAATTFLALRWMPYPFVVIGVVLLGLALVYPRLTTLVNAPVLVAALAVALALRWYVPAGPNTPLAHVLIFVSAMLVVVPAQVVAVVMARQRTLSEMLSAVGSRVDDILVFTDMQGIYRWVNQAREIYWGEPKERVLGRTWVENLGQAAYESNVRLMFERARAGEVARKMIDFDFPVRGSRTLDMLMQPARDEDGRQIGVLYCGTDVTELESSRRELQRVADQLRAANGNLEQFVRISSHDLREPLNTIMQFCTLLGEHPGAQLDETARLYVAQVNDGAARMKRMLDDVQQFVRLEGLGQVQLEHIDLDALAAEVRAALAARIEASGARLVVAPLGGAHGHRALVALVLQNLVANAVKFMPPGRTPVVEVFAARENGETRLSVRDNGIGIEAARLGELGTPFRMLHSRRKYEGTGLGLAICKRIAEQLGGRIEIESVPGQGSCFSLVLREGGG